VGGAFHAFDDTCRHGDCPLAEGGLNKIAVLCPCPFPAVDVRTRPVLAPPAPGPIKVYPVRVQGNDLQLGLLCRRSPSSAPAPRGLRPRRPWARRASTGGSC